MQNGSPYHARSQGSWEGTIEGETRWLEIDADIVDQLTPQRMNHLDRAQKKCEVPSWLTA